MNKRREIRMRSLKAVFPDDILHAEIARLLVLYEDLKIEGIGITKKIRALGSTGDGTYAHRYFLRRAVATLTECGSCMASLNTLPEFKKLKEVYFTPDAVSVWNDSVRLLSKKDRKWMINSIRNDVGGHFGLGPARRAVSSFRTGTVGKIEYCRDLVNRADDSIGCHFVGEITARAFVKDANANPIAEFEKLMDTVSEAHSAVLRAVPYLIASHLWPRFGLA